MTAATATTRIETEMGEKEDFEEKIAVSQEEEEERSRVAKSEDVKDVMDVIERLREEQQQQHQRTEVHEVHIDTANVEDNTQEEEQTASEATVSPSSPMDARQYLPERRRESRYIELPAGVIERILYRADPETFASLTLLSHAWRTASQKPDLYAYQLSRCPSYALSNGDDALTGPFTDADLSGLRTKFVQEIKRNLFISYLRPKQTTISLISTTVTSSSAAFPGGEAFDFTFSPRGLWCLGLSSSRVFVIDTAAKVVSVKRELKVPRRPLSAYISDDGERIAVLSTDHQVNLYDLTARPPKHLHTISLDNPPNVITLSPGGEVLAAAFDGGVEVHSILDKTQTSTSRSVKCDRVDSLRFSDDGTMLLGTTQGNKDGTTVILSAPYFTENDHDMEHSEMISHMWTSQIIFPNSSRDCSHSALLPHRHDGDASWTLTYDRVFQSFRAVRTDDLRNGTTYFTGPKHVQFKSRTRQRRKSKTKLTPCTLPSVNRKGDLVAAGFFGNEIWLYGVPSELDLSQLASPDEQIQNTVLVPEQSVVGAASSSVSNRETFALERPAPWQALVEKHRNVFTQGRMIAKVSGVANMTWLRRDEGRREPHSISERLIVGAPGGVSSFSELEEEDYSSVDGGRLVILDFDRTVQHGGRDQFTIEVGNAEPELLEEKSMDMDTEIAIVRRRTVARRDNVHSSRISVADALRPLPGEDIPAMPPLPATIPAVGFGLEHTAALTSPRETTDPVSRPDSPAEGMTLAEVSEALDGPYSHTNPRSRQTLYRSATAVEASRQRMPARVPAAEVLQFRRTDGTELPHESDADNWVPPPPPYSPAADEPLPEHLRRTLVPRHQAAGGPHIPGSRLRSFTVHTTSAQDAAARRRSSADVEYLVDVLRRPLPQRQYSEDSSMTHHRLHAHSNASTSTFASADTTSRNPLTTHSSLRRPHTVVERRSSLFSPDPLPEDPPALPPIPTISPFPSQFPSRSSTVSSARPPSMVLQARRTAANPPVPPLPLHETPLDVANSIVSPLQSAHSPHMHSQSQSTAVSSPSSASDSTYPPNTAPLTLSGKNLQQRLDYPLPPRPQDETPGVSPEQSPELQPQQLQTAASMPTLSFTEEENNVSPPRQPSPPQRASTEPSRPPALAQSLAPSSPFREAIGPLPMPSAYQLNNLQNRQIEPSPSASATTTLSSARPYFSQIRPNYQNFHLPKPPRAAKGAAGGPSSAPYYPPRSISAFAIRPRPETPAQRSVSRQEPPTEDEEISSATPDQDHDFSWKTSASMIDLGTVARNAGSSATRPSARRLDTITSIASRHDVNEGRAATITGSVTTPAESRFPASAPPDVNAAPWDRPESRIGGVRSTMRTRSAGPVGLEKRRTRFFGMGKRTTRVDSAATSTGGNGGNGGPEPKRRKTREEIEWEGVWEEERREREREREREEREVGKKKGGKCLVM
ncbi:hypothetical protein MMC25_003034 [Agyrium rufum]|nr:hypothetical protein [Agyrium rufum]